jgi:hypothetical protein
LTNRCLLDVYSDDEEAESAAMMDAMRARWPEATDDAITRGYNLYVVATESADRNTT